MHLDNVHAKEMSERERDKWKSYHCRKLRRNAIKFTFLLGSLFLLRFHYAILRSNNELFCIFLFGTFAHGKSGKRAKESGGGYPWKDNESDEKKRNEHETTTAAAAAASTNAVKTVKTCVILCWCSTTSKAPKMVFDGTLFFPGNILT